jgi:EAL domain-containing protein (putative c-di-GMP-specific phosphodiesterase class I)
MTQTSHHVDPIRPGGGLRRLRKGDLSGINDAAPPRLLTSAQFMTMLTTEIEQSRRNETYVLVTRVRLRPFPGSVEGPVWRQSLPDELLDRIQTVNERARTAIVSPCEVLVLVPGLGRRSDGEDLASGLIAALQEPVVIDRLPYRAAPVAGAAVLDNENPTAELLVEGAGLALDEADNTRRVVLFHPYQRVRSERSSEMKRALREAVLNGEIRCALQPAFDLRTRRVVAFEAFARWTRRDKGPVPPVDFLPMAQDLGVTPMLGRQVLARALATVAGLLADGVVGEVTLWINVTPDEVLDPDFVPTLRTAIEVDPRIKIGLELNPTPPADDKPLFELLKLLAGRGARAAVADFGVGNANLTVLRQLPFDSVKLDRVLTRQIAGNAEAAELLRALLRLADQLDLEATAQGIESEAQAQLLAELGCGLGQGYFYAEPEANPDILRANLTELATPAS